MINTDCIEIFKIEYQALDQVSDQVEWETRHHMEVWYNVSKQVKNPVWFKVFV